MGTSDNVARKIKEQYGDFAARIEFNLLVRGSEGHERLRAVMRDLQAVP